jgi:nucleoside-diphosphate-sugar epimerase
VVPLPLPGNGIAPLNVVPVDFVVRAAVRLASDARARGQTFHLVDPSPMSVARVYELIAERANRRIPRLTFPARAAEAVLRLPLLERVTRPQRAALGYINQLAWFTSANTLDLLEGTGIRCPRLSTYLDTLIAYVREDYARRQAAEAETLVEDPLDEGAKANA